jgi:DNA helicase II / ATP-dependent DNA helicase PcrA
MNYSSYQTAILNHAEGPFNLQIEAVAGSGKTFTLTEFAKRLPKEDACLAVAYNKAIAEDFTLKFPENCHCSTLHSLGYSIIRQHLKRVVVNDRKVDNIFKYKILGYDQKTKKFPSKKDQSTYWTWHTEIKDLISLCKAQGIKNPDLIPVILPELAEQHEIDMPEISLLIEIYDLSLQQTSVIDYDDMLLLPLTEQMEFPHYRHIFVDEAQDLNKVQQLFIEKLASHGGRLVIAGDSRQSIYGFRGAETAGMQDLKVLFDCIKLPLSISYRCSKSVVKLAQTLVPRIEPSEAAPEGLVATISKDEVYSKVETGDFILCRCTAPLVEYYLKLKSLDRECRIAGARFATKLYSTIEDIERKFGAISSTSLLQQREIYNQISKNFKRKALLDQLSVIESFYNLLPAAEAAQANGVRNAIAGAYSDSFKGIVLSTIHSVKGKEAKRVFLIHPELIPHPLAKQVWEIEQENNLHYVAVTRAKEEFYYVPTEIQN